MITFKEKMEQLKPVFDKEIIQHSILRSCTLSKEEKIEFLYEVIETLKHASKKELKAWDDDPDIEYRDITNLK